MKKILFATTVFDEVENGPGTYARYLWEAFKNDEKLEFHLVAPQSRVQHPRLHIAGNPQGSLNLYKAIQTKIYALQRELGPFDFLHANNAHMLAGFDAPNLPCIVQVNDYEVAESFVRPMHTIKDKGFKRSMSLAWRRYHEERVLKQSTLAITNSQYVMRTICEQYALVEDRCKNVYKAVDLSLFLQKCQAGALVADARHSSNQIDFRIIFIGSNWQIKGLDVLLAAVSKLDSEGSNLQLTVVGGGQHSQNEKIRAQFADLESRGVVRYVGRKSRDEIPELLSEADVSVLPSRQEALGVSVLESMAVGVPVIAARVGGIPEILCDGKYGMEFLAEDVNELALALKAFLHSSDLRLKFSAAGLVRVRQFSKTFMVEQIRNIYLNPLTERGQLYSVA